MQPKGVLIFGTILVLFVVGLIVSITAVDITTVRGNEVGVLETWGQGVDPNSRKPKTYFLFPGWTQDMYKYDMTPKACSVNDFNVKAADNQQMTFDMTLRWRYDPEKIVDIHKQFHSHTGLGMDKTGQDRGSLVVQERIIEPVLKRVANTEGTKRTAIQAYSGDSFAKLQGDIENGLLDAAGDLKQHGILIETFVLKVDLDPAYANEIQGRQIAQQKELRMVQEQKAAEAEAKKVEAEARADYNIQVVAAERDKQMEILKSEAAKQQQINEATAQAEKVRLAAIADAEKVRVAAQAEAEAGELKGRAILAIGQAEAEAQKLRLQAYAVDGADAYVQVQIAENMAKAFQNIDGYLPEKMNINLLSDSFMQAVRSVVKPVMPALPVGK